MINFIQKQSRTSALIVFTLLAVVVSVLLDYLIAKTLGHKLTTSEDLLRATIIPLVVFPFIISHLKDTLDKLQKQEETLENLSAKDILTGLYSRQTFYLAAEKQHNLSVRNKHPYCILTIDMDGFKQINDNYSHQCGDKVLMIFGKAANDVARTSDILARINGEEFAFFLSDTTPEQAKAFSERLFEKIRKRVVICKDKYIQYTISIGIGSNDCKDKTSLQETMKESNQALEVAKEKGGNSIEEFEGKRA